MDRNNRWWLDRRIHHRNNNIHTNILKNAHLHARLNLNPPSQCSYLRDLQQFRSLHRWLNHLPYSNRRVLQEAIRNHRRLSNPLLYSNRLSNPLQMNRLNRYRPQTGPINSPHDPDFRQKIHLSLYFQCSD